MRNICSAHLILLDLTNLLTPVKNTIYAAPRYAIFFSHLAFHPSLFQILERRKTTGFHSVVAGSSVCQNTWHYD
jgi:hypothetical protein